MRQKLLEIYDRNQTRFDVSFFVAGFFFDVFTLASVDDLLSIAQQILYLSFGGFILGVNILLSKQCFQLSEKQNKYWNYSPLVFHFILGGLLSVYSLFFLKSSSLFSSLIFMVFMVGLLVINEVKSVQKSQGLIKIALFTICLLSFFSILVPVVLGFVGYVPTFLAIGITLSVVFGFYKFLLYKCLKKDCVHDVREMDQVGLILKNKLFLMKNFLRPSGIVIIAFLVFYIFGWIPPVPMAVQHMGIYHNIEKSEGTYILSHEKPFWKFWHDGDQSFIAQEGDKIYFFASVYSPARFNDSVYIRWYYKDPKSGWKATDRIPMKVSGGRSEGYRGFSIKQNYEAGEWRVSVETTDGREMGRMYVYVDKTLDTQERVFTKIIR